MPMPADAVGSGSKQISDSSSSSNNNNQKLQPGLSSLFSRFTGRSRSSSSPAQAKKAVGAASTAQREDAQDRLASILASAKHHHQQQQQQQQSSSSSQSGKRKKATAASASAGGSRGHNQPVPQFFGAGTSPDVDLEDEGPYAPTSPSVFLDLLARSAKGSEAPDRLKLVQSLGDSVILFDEIDALQVWLSPSASALLDATHEPVSIRLAGLKLLYTCITATEATLHIATRKLAFYNSICRYGVEVKDCTEEELDALIEALSALCKGGRDVAALDGLVERTCDFAGEKFKRRQAQRDQLRLQYFEKHPSFSRLTPDKDPAHVDPPLLDPLHASVFVSYPLPWSTPSGNAKSPAMTLLTNIHKFGFPLLSQDTVAFATAYLVAEALATSNDLIISSIIDHMDVISRFGYVPSSQIEGVVFFLARVVATEGRQRVLTFISDQGEELHEPILKPLPGTLASEAKRVINNLLRSTANQALAQLREGTKPPSPDEPQRDLNVVIGCLRCLRHAMSEIRTSMKHISPDNTANSTYLDSWPIMLSLGIPFFFNNLCDALEWSSAHVNLEVLRIIMDRLIAASALKQDTAEAANQQAVSYSEWGMIMDLLREVLRNIQRFEEEDKVLWLLNLTGAQNQADLRQDTTHQDAKSAVLSLCRRTLLSLLHDYLQGRFEGSTDRLFNLLYTLGPNLTDGSVVILLEGYSRENICLPSNPEWLDALNDIVVGFLMTDAGDLYAPEPHDVASAGAVDTFAFHLQRPIRPKSRLKTLKMVAETYESVRDFEEHRVQLLDRIVMPTFEYLITGHVEPEEAIVLSSLLVYITKDALRQMDSSEQSKNSDELLSRIQTALQKVVNPQVDMPTSLDAAPADGTEAQPARRPSAGPAHISTNPDIALFATVRLIDIFTTALSIGGPNVSKRAVVSFRHLLRLVQNPTTPRKARFALLQFMLRLRATARHRVTFQRDIDITGLAEIVSRTASSALNRGDSLHESSSVQRVKSEEAAAGDRRRGRRTNVSGSPERRESRSKSRIRFTHRTSAQDVQVPGDPLWHVPETLPFSTPEQLGEDTIGLVSFDHNIEWKDFDEAAPKESEFESYDAALAARPCGAPVLLPVSEYLKALQEILHTSTDWDLVAYMLCHLPVQLSCKHFFAGPRASRQIQALRTLLVEGFMNHTLAARTLLPEGSRRSDLPSLAYHTLATLIAYKSLFTKGEQDELVQTFASGLPQREVAKPCIHALAMACHELQPSMTKHLSQILANLHKIMSTAKMAVHILELIASIGHLPTLFSSFTTEDYRTVLGIALQYLLLHNDKAAGPIAANAQSEDAGAGSSTKADDLNHAFAQYVFHLAYIVIELWYMRMRLNQRRQLAPFIIRKLLQANETKGGMDEPCEVCLDMIARFGTCDIDPRPKRSGLKETLWHGSNGQVVERTWLQGHAVVTIRCLAASKWAEVVIRRPSGVANLLLEMANATEPVVDAVSAEMLDTILQHRGSGSIKAPADLPERLSEVSPDGLITLEQIREKLGATAVSQRPPEVESTQPTASAEGPSQASGHLGSGSNSLTPSFFALQLSAFPEFGNIGPPLLVPEDDRYSRSIRNLDAVPVVDFHKIGVVYIGQDDYTESDILSNTHGSKDFVSFLSGLGDIIRLRNNTEYYVGGLDREQDMDGKWAYVWSTSGVQTIYHVTTLMPTSLERDPQCIGKKRHIGNDFVKIIFNDSGRPFHSDMLPGQFNFVDIVIEPQTPAGKSWTAHGMSSNTSFFKVSMQRRADMPEIGPLGVFKMVSDKSLAKCVRHLALYANIFAQVFLECVGIEGRQGARNKTRYVSNWGRRLQYINQLRERVLQSQQPNQEGVSSPSSPRKPAPPPPQTMEELCNSLDLSKWAY